MKNELRLLVCNWLISWIIRIAPKNKEGIILISCLLDYLKESAELNHIDYE